MIALVKVMILGIWTGGWLFIGFGAVPLLFSAYPKALAGDIAGLLFELVEWSGVAWAALFALSPKHTGLGRYWWLAVVLWLSFERLLVAPKMQFLKAAGMNETLQFAWLHHMATMFYILVAVLLLVSFWRALNVLVPRVRA